jgi:protein-S-isoprenylcysteine O-methyltransferase Ste14
MSEPALKARAQNHRRRADSFHSPRALSVGQTPWYLVAIMLFWSSVDFTSDRLLLNVLWSDWVCLGTRLEQIDLVSDFGEVYEKYRGRVRMLIPWHHPIGM